MTASSLATSIIRLSLLLWLLAAGAVECGAACSGDAGNVATAAPSRGAAAANVGAASAPRSAAASEHRPTPTDTDAIAAPVVAPLRGASATAAATAAPITVHRSPLHAAPPPPQSVARYDSGTAETRAGASARSDVPLFPRAANPATEFQAVLDLARGSATRHAVADIEDGNYVAALAKLDALAAGSFHWRGAVSNGYQQGFFLYALRGYCLETLGEVVKAYRSYQHSRACVDEDASWALREPLAEVCLGIGRTCVEATRYADALSWLNAARFEGAANSNIISAANRSLTRRAIEIGDYHDAITNMEDLMTLTTPTREEYRQLAQLYFWTHHDQEGFRTLRDGLFLMGIDKERGMSDPILRCYWAFLQRASYADIKDVYDILGNAICEARSLKGDEHYLADLVNTRKLLRDFFPILPPYDDLGKVTKRVDQVRQVLRQPQHGGSAHKPAVPALWHKDHALVSRHCVPCTQDDPANVMEDTLMALDLFLRRCQRSGALALMSRAVVLLTNTVVCTHMYDGVCARANLDICALKMALLSDLSSDYVEAAFDRVVRLPDTNQRQLASVVEHAVWQLQHEKGVSMRDLSQLGSGLPMAHPSVLRYIQVALQISARSGATEIAKSHCEDLLSRKYSADKFMMNLIGLYITHACYPQALSLLCQVLSLTEDDGEKQYYLGVALQTWSWADNTMQETMARTMRKAALPLSEVSRVDLARVLHTVNNLMPQNQRIAASLRIRQYQQALYLLTPEFDQPQHWQWRAYALSRLGRSNDAVCALAMADNKASELARYCGMPMNRLGMPAERTTPISLPESTQ